MGSNWAPYARILTRTLGTFRQHDLVYVEVVLVEVPDTAGHHLQPPLQLVTVQVHEESAMRQVVGRNGSKQMTVVVVFVVAVDSAFVEPRKIIDDFQDELIAFVYLLEHFSHGAGRILRILESSFQDVQNGDGFCKYVGHPPLVPGIEFYVDSVFIVFVDVVEVGVPVLVVDVRDGLEVIYPGASEVDLAVDVPVDFHFLQEVLVGGLELIQPLQDVFFHHKQTVEHLVGLDVEILSPFHDVGSANDDPLVFEGQHCSVHQDHRTAGASQATQEDALAGGGLVVEAGKIGHLLVDLEGRCGVQFFKPLGEVLGRGVYFLTHDLLDGLVGHCEDVVDSVDVLEDGVDQSVADD